MPLNADLLKQLAGLETFISQDDLDWFINKCASFQNEQNTDESISYAKEEIWRDKHVYNELNRIKKQEGAFPKNITKALLKEVIFHIKFNLEALGAAINNPNANDTNIVNTILKRDTTFLNWQSGVLSTEHLIVLARYNNTSFEDLSTIVKHINSNKEVIEAIETRNAKFIYIEQILQMNAAIKDKLFMDTLKPTPVGLHPYHCWRAKNIIAAVMLHDNKNLSLGTKDEIRYTIYATDVYTRKMIYNSLTTSSQDLWNCYGQFYKGYYGFMFNSHWPLEHLAEENPGKSKKIDFLENINAAKKLKPN